MVVHLRNVLEEKGFSQITKPRGANNELTLPEKKLDMALGGNIHQNETKRELSIEN